VLDELPPTDLVASKHSDAPNIKDKKPKLTPESAHSAPTSAVKKVPGYSRSKAVTALLPKHLHTTWDNHWKRRAREILRETPDATTISVRDLLACQEDGLLTLTLEGKLSPSAAGALQMMLHHEYFDVLLLDPNDLVRLPFSQSKK